MVSFEELIYSPLMRQYRLGLKRSAKVTEGDKYVSITMPNGEMPWDWGPDTRNRSNWFGVSVYHPDWVATNGAVTILMSLGGLSTPNNEKYNALWDTRSIRYICITLGGERAWETWTGDIPPQDVLDRIHSAMCNASDGSTSSPFHVS